MQNVESRPFKTLPFEINNTRSMLPRSVIRRFVLLIVLQLLVFYFATSTPTARKWNVLQAVDNLPCPTCWLYDWQSTGMTGIETISQPLNANLPLLSTNYFRPRPRANDDGCSTRCDDWYTTSKLRGDDEVENATHMTDAGEEGVWCCYDDEDLLTRSCGDTAYTGDGQIGDYYYHSWIVINDVRELIWVDTASGPCHPEDTETRGVTSSLAAMYDDDRDAANGVGGDEMLEDCTLSCRGLSCVNGTAVDVGATTSSPRACYECRGEHGSECGTDSFKRDGRTVDIVRCHYGCAKYASIGAVSRRCLDDEQRLQRCIDSERACVGELEDVTCVSCCDCEETRCNSTTSPVSQTHSPAVILIQNILLFIIFQYVL